LDDEIAQAAAHGVADQERTGQDRHRRRHAGDYREIRSPVVAKATKDEGARLHERRPRPSTKVTKTPRHKDLLVFLSS
jgi:hypothetical protein